MFRSDYHVRKAHWIELCPECRIESYKEAPAYKITGKVYVPVEKTAREIIQNVMIERETTLKELESKGIPKEFVKFCIEK